jgi:DNA-binding transcriptional MerR regulator
MPDAFSIGALAAATGTKPETIRWYEREGLLPAPVRSGGNYRVYGRGDLERLGFIRRARELGFTLGQVRELLALANRRDQPCEEVDAIARGHLADVEHKIADLLALKDELSGLIGQCSHGTTVAECRIVAALSARRPALAPAT